MLQNTYCRKGWSQSKLSLLRDSSLSVSLMDLLTDIVLWEKGMKETNTLAYFGREIDIACKKWYSAGPGGYRGHSYKTFYSSNLLIFVIS